MKWIFLLLHVLLNAAQYDCIFIGSSPFSLLEALYRAECGKKVLILEAAPVCGGAWKSIPICGVEHADLGCHQIGSDPKLKAFFEEWIGCKIVSLDYPLSPFEEKKGCNGFYFSKGCYELIDHLLAMVQRAGIELHTNAKVEQIHLNKEQKIALVQTKEAEFTTHRIVATPMSCLNFSPCSSPAKMSRYYHLYLLVQDPTEPKFSYKGAFTDGASRMMNLTHFAGLAQTGRQLIVIQTHNEKNMEHGEKFLAALKKANLLDPSAYILQAEPFTYEAGTFQQNAIRQEGAEDFVEILQTGHLQTLTHSISKWQEAIRPYR
jgi:hypothetical protein